MHRGLVHSGKHVPLGLGKLCGSTVLLGVGSFPSFWQIISSLGSLDKYRGRDTHSIR